MKRAFDITAAAVGLVVLSPLFVLVALAIKLDSPGPVLFTQERVGRNFRSFRVYKFRTMAVNVRGALLTVGEDSRITRIGRFLRKTKIDELPQLFNILVGQMSFVGPRPEVPSYVDMFRADYAELLKVRPGLTDLASLKYREESALLARAEDPEAEYIGRVLPDKIHLSKQYIQKSSFFYDVTLIFATLRQLVSPGRVA